MKRLIVGAAALALAWFFVLFSIATLGVIAAIATPAFEQSHAIGVDTIHTDLAFHPAVQHNSVAHTAVVHGTWASLAGLGIAALFLCTLALIALFGLKKLIHGSEPRQEQDGAVVQELFTLGKNLESRMETLETILLERGRPAP
jgi:hypothetical protein